MKTFIQLSVVFGAIIGVGLMISSETKANQKTVTQVVSFYGVVPDIQCNTYATDLPNYKDLIVDQGEKITRENWRYEERYPFSNIDYNADGSLSEIELSVFKNRNCIQ